MQNNHLGLKFFRVLVLLWIPQAPKLLQLCRAAVTSTDHFFTETANVAPWKLHVWVELC